MKSYVDNFFGGPVKSNKGLNFDKMRANLLFKQLIAVGELTGARMNFKKCCPPARKMEILGFMYDAITRSCRLSDKKRPKYMNRIDKVLESAYVTQKTLEKLVGNLTLPRRCRHLVDLFCQYYRVKLPPSKNDMPILTTASMKNALLV